MKKFFLFLFSLFVGIGLLVWIVRSVGWDEIKLVFISFSVWKVIIILALTFLGIMFSIWKWNLILKSQGYKISGFELPKLYLSGYSIAFLFPMLIFGAEIFRGYSLKERYSIPWQKAISSVIIERILETTSYLVTIFFGLIYFLLKIGLPPRNLGIALGVVLLFFTVATIFFYFKSFRRESIVKFFLKKFNSKSNNSNSLIEIEKEIFKFFKPKKLIMWQGFSLAFLRVIAYLARSWILILFLGKSIGFFSVLSILGFFYLSTMIPIPAALGFHEAFQSFAFNSLGLGANTGIAFALIIRGVELIIVLLGFLILLRVSFDLIKITFFKKIRRFVGHNKI